VRRGNYRRESLVEYVALRAATGGVGIALEAALPEEHRARLAQIAPASPSTAA